FLRYDAGCIVLFASGLLPSCFRLRDGESRSALAKAARFRRHRAQRQKTVRAASPRWLLVSAVR
ncbi:hypothetical protein, partial [Acidaminococcus intestini]|uniref:hypothetical protein n=1 Tax=Acidaminococcus intestini TaxID=187327 RepID=UPI0030792695